MHPSARPHDLETVRQIAGDRAGVISISASDACANIADILTEDLWLIVEALHPDDFVKTTHQGHHQVDTYCVTVGLLDFHLEFILHDNDDTPILILTTFQRING